MRKITLTLSLILIMAISLTADSNVLRDTLIRTLEITTDEERLRAYDSIANRIRAQAQPETEPDQRPPSLFSWTYKEFTDPIDDTKKIVFSKNSEDTIDGVERAILFIRHVNDRTDVFVNWGRPLNASSEDTVPVIIRLDRDTAFQEVWDIGNSLQSTFSTSSDDLIQKLFDASIMAVRTQGRTGPLTVTFDIRGFKQLAERFDTQLNWIKQNTPPAEETAPGIIENTITEITE
jgi:hypothetical protein